MNKDITTIVLGAVAIASILSVVILSFRSPTKETQAPESMAEIFKAIQQAPTQPVNVHVGDTYENSPQGICSTCDEVKE